MRRYCCIAAAILSVSGALHRPVAASTAADSIVNELRASGAFLQFRDSFPLEFKPVQESLFVAQRFETIGKLMTLFLRDKKKAYKFSAIGDSIFLIKSRKTVRPGSTLRILAIDSSRLEFVADLVFTKGGVFSSQVLASIRYSTRGNSTVCGASIWYTAPAAVRGINSSVRFVTGIDLLGWKISDFVRRPGIVMQRIALLAPRQWRELASDTKLLQSLYYPVAFSADEVEFLAGALEKKR
jgi:hypothetical protein